MRMANRWLTTLTAVLLLAAAGTARATEPAITTITVPTIHCPCCASGVEKKLAKVPGVARVQTNVKAKMFFVTPNANTRLSPKQLWEAVLNARQRPSLLEGPSGKFTTKPGF